MKTLLIIGFLLIGLSGQAFSMGHPHNMFTARKHMRAKTLTSVVKTKLPIASIWQPTVQLPRKAFSEYILLVLAQLR